MYSLVVAKNGPKLTAHIGEGEGGSHTNSGSGKTTMTVTKGNDGCACFATGTAGRSHRR
jgi:hypothetical protein